MVWARPPVRQSVRKEQLAQYIATIAKPRFDGLSDRGLTALTRLHGVELQEGDDRPTIENVGVVGGIAQKLRGAADLYVREKLDEIERRIDSKLDEIDRRLGEWRDQEVRNRLRIIKITLVTAIIVAVISLGYDYIKSRSEVALEAREPVAGRTGDASAEQGM